MSKLRNFLLGLFVSFLLTSPGHGAPGFDCAKANSAVEHMICNDPGLSEGDRELSTQFQKLLALPGADTAALRRSENDWLMNIRDRCVSARCLVKAYFDRGNEFFTVARQIDADRLDLPISLISPPSKIIATIAVFGPSHLISFQEEFDNHCVYVRDQEAFGGAETFVTAYDISSIFRPERGCTRIGNEPNQYTITDPSTLFISAVWLSGRDNAPFLDGQDGFFTPDPLSNDGAIGMIGVNQRSLVWLRGATIEALADTSRPGLFVALFYLKSGEQRLVILRCPMPQLDLRRLDTVDQRLEVAVPPPTVAADAFYSGNIADAAVAALENAGVRQLFNHLRKPPSRRRLQILHDYLAFLTYSKHDWAPTFSGHVLNGGDVVDTVALDGQFAALQPQSSAAWKQYADAAFSGISAVPTFAMKRDLTGQALTAYYRLEALGVALTPEATAFQTINMTTAPQSDVCNYVAYMFNNNLANQLPGIPQPADVFGDGRLVNVSIDAEGTAHDPTLSIQDADGSEDDAPDTGDWNIHAFPFQGGYYILETENYDRSFSGLGSSLYAVQSFSGGQPCSFVRKDNTAVVIDRLPGPLQGEGKKGSAIRRLDFTQPNPEPLLNDGADANGGETVTFVKTDIGGKALPNRLWLVSTASDDLPCHSALLGWYDTASGQLLNDALNEQLQNEQQNIGSCAGSTGALIESRGKTYIQLSVPEPVNDGDTLFEVLSVIDHKLVPVYREVQKSTVYIPHG